MMKAFRFLLLMLMLSHSALAFGVVNVSALELAQDSDFVLAGTLRHIKGTQAEFVVDQVIKGANIAPVVKVAPVNWNYESRLFKENETVVLFLKRGAVLELMCAGAGAITYKPETKNETIEGVKQLLKLPLHMEKDAITQVMLAWIASDNAVLRTEAQRYIRTNPLGRDNGQKYKAQLLELLKNPASDVRETALSGLRFIGVPEALPLIIEMTRDADLRVVQSASLALAQYDTPESAAALIALTKHPNPNVRVRALIDLDNIRRPEAKVALVALLDAPDPKVRALAPRGLVMWLRRGEARDVLPKLITMLTDPVEEVQVWTAQALGESRDAEVVPALLDVLRRPNLSENLEGRTMEALSLIYTNLPTVKQIDDNLPLIIVSLERGHWLAGLHAVSILGKAKTPQSIAALRRAAEKHAKADVRDSAQRQLARQ